MEGGGGGGKKREEGGGSSIIRWYGQEKEKPQALVVNSCEFIFSTHC